MSTAIVRPVAPGDAAAITDIYAHHVLHGTATFDFEPRSLAEWTAKIAECSARGWPFLVAVDAANTALGYAYATQFRDRPAYAHTCENSIYIRADLRGQGVGRLLLEGLIDAARDAGFREMIAVIGGGEPASVALHARCGFRHAGRMEKVGLKFGRLLDTVYMQLSLNEGS